MEVYVVEEVYSIEWIGEMEASVEVFATLEEAQKYFNLRKKVAYKDFDIKKSLQNDCGEIIEDKENEYFSYCGDDGSNENRIVLSIEKKKVKGGN